MTTNRSGKTVLLAAALLASGCKSSPEATAVVPPSADNLKAFQAAGGLTDLGAAFLAMSKLEASSSEKGLYHFTVTFPTNTTADVTFRVTPGQRYTPTADETANAPREPIYGATLSDVVQGDTHHLKLVYFLPDGVIPIALDGSAGGAERIRLTNQGVLLIRPVGFRARNRTLRGRRAAQAPGTESGAQIIVEAAVKEFSKEAVATVEEAVLEATFGKTAKQVEQAVEAAAKDAAEETGPGNPASTASSAFSDILEALEMNAEHTEIIQDIAEIEEMVEHPSNALTEKAYENDPGLKQRLLDEIADLKTEVAANTALQFVNKEISVGIGLTKVPGLSALVSTLAEWNGKTMKQVIKERIANLRRQVSTGFLNNKGPIAPPSVTVTPSIPNSTSNPGPNVPPGSWLCEYSGTLIQPWSNGGTITTHDEGYFIFKVNSDGSLNGTGGGRVTVNGVAGNASAKGGTGYTFTIGGTAVDALQFWTTPDGAIPGEFKLTVVTAQGTSTITSSNNGPFLFSGQGLKLEHGSSAHYQLVQTGINDTRVMTIK